MSSGGDCLVKQRVLAKVNPTGTNLAFDRFVLPFEFRDIICACAERREFRRLHLKRLSDLEQIEQCTLVELFEVRVSTQCRKGACCLGVYNGAAPLPICDQAQRHQPLYSFPNRRAANGEGLHELSFRWQLFACLDPALADLSQE